MEKPVNLLWTSGADSTFRLMELLLVQKRKVQPYYVMDRTRRSLDFEIKAMERIKKHVFKKHPDTIDLLLPTKFKELTEVKPNPTISEKYNNLASIEHLGVQYDWLPRFAEQEKIYDLELSITSGEHSDSYFKRFLKPHLLKEDTGNFHNYRLKDNPPNPDLTIFKYFRFPIIEWSKLEMQELARRHNFSEVVEMTWFCHYPIDGQPCGLCNPCKIAIKEGMSRRIPFKGLLRNFVYYKVKPLIPKREITSSKKTLTV